MNGGSGSDGSLRLIIYARIFPMNRSGRLGAPFPKEGAPVDAETPEGFRTH